jgi:3-keto-disaccharide hydrolase
LRAGDKASIVSKTDFLPEFTAMRRSALLRRLGLTLTTAGVFSAMLAFRVAAAEEPGEKSPPEKAAAESLFDGKSLGKWKPTAFGGEGEVEVKDGRIVMHMGNPMTGITWSGKYPKMNYEISLEAMRVDGSDFFCGLTFPVGDAPCSFICGGWGGGVVGLSSLDGMDASENETTKYREFQSGRWYKIRVRVTPERISAWIDDKQMADVETKDHKISIRIEVELSRPLGISCYQTTAALRDIKIRSLDAGAK